MDQPAPPDENFAPSLVDRIKAIKEFDRKRAAYDSDTPEKPHDTVGYLMPGKAEPEKPIRVGMLEHAIALTGGARNVEYGEPFHNLSCAGKLQAIMREYIAREISHAELAALDNVLFKLSRVITGTPKPDSYVDGAAYFAIAGECAEIAAQK